VGSRGRAVALAIALVAVVAAALAGPAAAAQILPTSVEAFPNGRVAPNGDLPPNAIDGSTSTFTWTTQPNTTDSPAFLAIGFPSGQVDRLRIFKTNESGGGTGTGVKNLVIQYTTGSGPLASRPWFNVPNLRNGANGAERLTATAVNGDGTVLGDDHSGSFASLTFDAVQATGLRVGFANVTSAGSCSVNPNGPCNHYRVAELEAHFDGTGASPRGVRIGDVGGAGVRLRVRGTDGRVRDAGEGDLLLPGEVIVGIGGDDAEVELEDGDGDQVVMQSSSQTSSCGNAVDEGFGPGTIRFEGEIGGEDTVGLSCGAALVETAAGSGSPDEHARGLGIALTPEATVRVRGRARVVRERRGATTVSSLRGAVDVTPANPTLRGARLRPGRQVRVTRTTIGAPFPLVPDLLNEIPSPRRVRAGPTIATAPSRISLRSLRSSKCVRVAVVSVRPARVLVTIFSGRRSIRLFGQRLVVFPAAGRTTTCIPVPRRAKTFDVRTPLRFAVGYALGARRRPGQTSPPPVIRPIRLVP
jgi:hypothetical protein